MLSLLSIIRRKRSHYNLTNAMAYDIFSSPDLSFGGRGGGGVVGAFEQLARYTMRFQESDFHLGLYSSLTSANNLNLVNYFLLPISSIVTVFIAKAGHVRVN